VQAEVAAAVEAARLQAQAAQVAAAARHSEGVELFEIVMSVLDYRNCLCDQLEYVLLSRFRVSRSMRRWIDPLLGARGVENVDVTAGVHTRVLRHLCAIRHRVVRLARGEYELEGDVANLANYASADANGHFPDGRKGYGPLALAKGVTLVGHEGVVLSGDQARLQVTAEGASFMSMHFPLGISINRGQVHLHRWPGCASRSRGRRENDASLAWSTAASTAATTASGARAM